MKCSKYIFTIIFFIIVVQFYLGCKKNPAEPPFSIRHLTWSIDTLAHYDNWQSFMWSICGNSADDLYVAGRANTTHGILWRYRFDQWFDIKISATQGGPIIGSISFEDVFCFSKNNVWVCGKTSIINPDPSSPSNFIHISLLVHWNGIEWKQIVTPDGNMLQSIWGSSPNDIWIGGINGTIFHYDGTIVQKDTIPLNIQNKTSQLWNILSITGNESETYMLLRGVKPVRYYLLTYQNEKWVIEDSTSLFNTNSLWMSPSGTLYAAGESSYKRKGKIWEKIIDGTNTVLAIGIYGTSNDNLFVVGQSINGTGAVYHFNGRDWLSINELEIPGVDYYDIWTDGKEVFVIGITGSKTIVLHGK